MKSLWQKIFGSAVQSNERAKSRLHFVLVQDRSGLGNDEMANFRKELVAVIEKYFEIDKERFDMDYQREGEETALVINSPVVVKKLRSKASVEKVEEAADESESQESAAV